MGIKRTEFLKTAAGAAAGATVAATASPWYSEAEAQAGSSVFVGLLCPITGSYSADGKDQQRGYELAMEDLNNGTGVMSHIPSLRGKKGLLGKTIEYKIGDTQLKPDLAVQLATNFITENKAVLIEGGVSSAEDLAIEKSTAQQKTLYMIGASGSNDPTGIACQRYCFRSQLDAYMVAKSLDPYLVKAYGPNRKMAFLTPDYSYGHSLTNSMKADLEMRGWKTAINVVAPFPITDYSSYLTNLANSDADVFINIEFGNDGITSTKQAVQFGILKKMKLVIPNISTYLPDGLGPEIMQGVYGTQDWYYSLADRFPLSKVFLETFTKKYPGVIPRWTAHEAYEQTAIWADAVAHVKSFNPMPIIEYLEKGNKVDLMLGPVWYRAGDHQQVRPCPVLIGKASAMMKSKDDFFNVVALVPGEQVMQPLNETGCKMPSFT